MNETIRIQAEVLQHDPASCRFTVSRALFDGFARFRDKDHAKGSPLAERLFAIEGVVGLIVQNNQVTITNKPPVNWRATGPSVGQAIREHVASGQIAVSPDVVKNAPVEDTLRVKVQTILDEQINPEIAKHKGVISLLDVQGTTLFIKMGGGCQGCSQSNVTLRSGVEAALRSQIPEITDIFDTTDHAAGKNPYYSPSHAH
jgi:Fe-S cluster biogenesis protein NfuA